MVDSFSDGNLRVSFVTTISNIHAPTTAELNAGTDLSSLITPDGLKTDSATGDIDTSNLVSTFSTQGAGRRSFDIQLTLKHQTGTDTAYTLLTYRTAGYLVVRRKVANATAWTSSQVVEVYPVVCEEPQEIAPAANTVQRFSVGMKMSSDPDTRAVIA
jgi:hypothetical protein